MTSGVVLGSKVVMVKERMDLNLNSKDEFQKRSEVEADTDAFNGDEGEEGKWQETSNSRWSRRFFGLYQVKASS